MAIRINHKTPPNRCRGCGKQIDTQDPRTVRIALGQLHDIDDGLEDFEEKGEVWGYMHEHCFLLAVGDPQAIRMVMPMATPVPTPVPT